MYKIKHYWAVIKSAIWVFRVLLLVLLMELFYFMSCDYGPCYRHFDSWSDQIMKVDSFFLSSDTINSSDVIAASFWGKIGGRMYCDTFGYFRESRAQFNIHITLFEKYFDVCPDTCTKTPTFMEGTQYYLNPPFSSGHYTVIIHQPDNSVINKGFNVR